MNYKQRQDEPSAPQQAQSLSYVFLAQVPTFKTQNPISATGKDYVPRIFSQTSGHVCKCPQGTRLWTSFLIHRHSLSETHRGLTSGHSPISHHVMALPLKPAQARAPPAQGLLCGYNLAAHPDDRTNMTMAQTCCS